MQPTRSRRRSAGFSFIEVMMVIVIIGLLAGGVGYYAMGYMEAAKVNRAKSDIATIEKAVEAYYLMHSQYPSNSAGLDALESLNSRTDPWGVPYHYNRPGRDGAPFEIYTLGEDNREGGEGVNQDIYSWNLRDQPDATPQP